MGRGVAVILRIDVPRIRRLNYVSFARNAKHYDISISKLTIFWNKYIFTLPGTLCGGRLLRTDSFFVCLVVTLAVGRRGVAHHILKNIKRSSQ